MTAMKISVCIFRSVNRSNAKSRTMQMYLPMGTSPPRERGCSTDRLPCPSVQKVLCVLTQSVLQAGV